MPYSPIPHLSPPGFEPIDFSGGIASLGSLIDALEQRRMKQAQTAQELAMKAQDREIAMGREARLEQQNLRQFRASTLKANQQAEQEQRDLFARGGSLRPMLQIDEQGNAEYVQPERIQDQPAPPMDQGPEDINSILATASPPTPESAPKDIDAMMADIGFGAPFKPMPEAPQSSSMVPGQVRGAAFNAPNEPATMENLTGATTPSERWQYRPKGRAPIVLDRGQVQDDLRRQREMEAEGIRQQLQNPNLDPMLRTKLDNQLAMILGGIPPKVGATITNDIGRDKDRASREGIAAAGNESRERIAAGHDATRLATSKYGRAGAARSAATELDPSTGANNPWAKMESKQRSREGNRLNREKRDWANNHGWTKLLSTNPGRLEWAAENISMEGRGAGAAQAEAMMNLFGVARGGVPVKNETAEFMRATRSLSTTLDEIGPSIGLPQLGTRLLNGEKLTGEDAKKYEDGVSAMPEQRRYAIARAIKSTQKALIGWGRRELGSLKTQWDVEPVGNRYKATAFINEMGAHLGLEPRQWWPDVPLSQTQQSVTDPNKEPAGGTASSALEAALGVKPEGAK